MADRMTEERYMPEREIPQDEPSLLETIAQLRATAPAPTIEANSQHWAGMDGAIAFHLIERHADNWADIGLMMGEWLTANGGALEGSPERHGSNEHEPAPAPTLAQPQTEQSTTPEYWQWRRKDEPWSLEKTFNSQVYATTPDSEVRGLYATPEAAMALLREAREAQLPDDVLSLLQRARLYTNERPARSEEGPFAAFRRELDAAIAKATQEAA